MNKKTVVTLFTVLIILIILGVVFFLVDFNLVVRMQEPKFCINTNVYNDAKTKEYIGIGYKIIRYNIGTENVNNIFGTWFLMYDDNLNIKEESQDIINFSSKYDIIGEVMSINQKDLILNIKSNSSESKYEEAVVKLSSDTIITKSGKEFYKKDLKVGQKVRVIFNNQVSKSIPPQAVASNFEIIE